MDGSVEQLFAPALGVLTIPGVLGDVGEQAGVEYALPIAGRIKAAIEVEVGPSEVQPHLFRHLFQRSQALREQDHICVIDGSHGDGSEHRAMVVDDGEDFLALLGLVAGIADAIAPFWATVLVPSPWSTLRASCFSTARCRTLATNACHSDPSSAQLAKTL
jgi:hypothetical protein